MRTHGIAATYTAGKCRCDACRKAHSDAQRERGYGRRHSAKKRAVAAAEKKSAALHAAVAAKEASLNAAMREARRWLDAHAWGRAEVPSRPVMVALLTALEQMKVTYQ